MKEERNGDKKRTDPNVLNIKYYIMSRSLRSILSSLALLRISIPSRAPRSRSGRLCAADHTHAHAVTTHGVHSLPPLIRATATRFDQAMNCRSSASFILCLLHYLCPRLNGQKLEVRKVNIVRAPSSKFKMPPKHKGMSADATRKMRTAM